MATLDSMASPERTTRTAGLDGLRAVAALSVICLHPLLAWVGLVSYGSTSGTCR